MKNGHIPESMARWAGVGLVLMAASQTSAAFGGAGSLENCATFTTCSAAVGSSTRANVRYVFQPHSLSYQLPVGMNPIVNGVSETWRSDVHAVGSAAPSRAAVGVGFDCFPAPVCVGIPFTTSAEARAQSGFAINRASAASGYAASGTDDHGRGISAAVGVGNDAHSYSAWRDVWTFTNSGHLSATVLLDGRASDASNTFPSSFTRGIPLSNYGNWSWNLKVWDVDNLRIGDYDEVTLGPTLVASVQDRSGIFNEQRPTFSSSLALDFDFVSGVQYVVIAELVVQASYGRTIDLYNTARLGGAVLSAGAQLNALSGHDYLAPVPEPGPALMWLGGLAAIALWSRRRLRTAEAGV